MLDSFGPLEMFAVANRLMERQGQRACFQLQSVPGRVKSSHCKEHMRHFGRKSHAKVDMWWYFILFDLCWILWKWMFVSLRFWCFDLMTIIATGTVHDFVATIGGRRWIHAILWWPCIPHGSGGFLENHGWVGGMFTATVIGFSRNLPTFGWFWWSMLVNIP